jgi:DNA-binding response OmpR family regulator/HPt (histidine-containing phosphotransfer) domain-containing protein
MPAPEAFSDVLAQLQARYLASSGNTIAAFTAVADQLQLNPTSPQVVDALRRELHRVHGTAGSYGFHEASRLAGALEPVAVRWAADEALDRPRRAAIVRQFVRALTASLAPARSEGAAASAVGSGHRLLLVEVPEVAAVPLVAEAIHRGYHVEQVQAQGVNAVFEAGAPTIVVASAHIPLSVPDGVPLILLRGADGVVAPRMATSRLMDLTVSPREILLLAESMAVRTGLLGVTLLVIEDDPDMSELLRALCERQGMFVETRGDARDIIETLEGVRPSLVMLDIGLPGVNGLLVTRTIRADQRFRELPIVLVSASTDVDTRAAAFVAGADDFQSKPVVAEELLRRIERLLDVRRQQQVSRGEHPGTGLLLPDRTTRTFGEAIVAAGAVAAPMSLALIRPVEPPDGTQRTALWHRELRLLATALGLEGVRGGFHDESAALFLFPMPAKAAVERLVPYAEASRSDLLPWNAGVAELVPGADPSMQQLARLAEEAWLAGRDVNEHVYLWDPEAAGTAPDVVVVEDDGALADLLTFALAARGLTWLAFTSGPEALSALRGMQTRGRHPLVLLDVDLPGLDGFSLHEQLRVERPGAFRVVFMSVHASEADQLRAIRAGALDYLAKPLSLRVLMAKIAGWRASAAVR